jgi:hypothetical protein
MYYIYISQEYKDNDVGSMFFCWVEVDDSTDKKIVKATHSFCDPLVIKEDDGLEYLGTFISFGDIAEWNKANGIVIQKDSPKPISNEIALQSESDEWSTLSTSEKELTKNILGFFSHTDSIVAPQSYKISNEEDSIVLNTDTINIGLVNPSYGMTTMPFKYVLTNHLFMKEEYLPKSQISKKEIDDIFQ